MTLTDRERLAQAIGHPLRWHGGERVDRARLLRIEGRPGNTVIVIRSRVCGVVTTGRNSQFDGRLVSVVEIAIRRRRSSAGAKKRGNSSPHRDAVPVVVDAGSLVVRCINLRLLDVGEQPEGPRHAVLVLRVPARRIDLAGLLVIDDAQAHLLEIVGAGHPPAGLAGRLHGGQEQADERANNGDHDQQLDQRKAVTNRSSRRLQAAATFDEAENHGVSS